MTKFVRFNVAKGTRSDKVVLAEGLGHGLDFSNCTEEELIELATKPVVIKLQAQYRDLSAAEVQKTDGVVVDVHELINRPAQRGPVDPAKALLNKVDRGELSADELDALIEQLKSKIA